jgi:TolB-like protein
MFFLIASLFVFAQGFYFDAGYSLGLGMSKIDSENGFWPELLLANGTGLRTGYGPFGNVPAYVVVEGNYDWVYPLFTAGGFFLGGGAIFYPTRLIQFGASFGTSLSDTDTDGYRQIRDKLYYQRVRKPGFGWNISAAVDFQLDMQNKHGLLLGLKYSGATSPIGYYDDAAGEYFVGNGTSQTHLFCVFFKYAYRKRVPQQTVAGNVAPKPKTPPPNTPSSPSRQTPRPSRSNTGIDGAIGRASQDLVNDLPEKTRVAVINVSSNNKEMSAYIVEELEYQLVRSGKFTIVDRNTLDTIRSEQNFQMSGEVSDSSAVSIGQMLGANIVITGSVGGMGTKQRLSIKALDVMTSQIVTMVREEF